MFGASFLAVSKRAAQISATATASTFVHFSAKPKSSVPRAPAPIRPNRTRSLAPRMRLVGVCPAAATPAALINPPKNSRRLDTVHLDSKNRSPFYSAAAAKGTGRYGSRAAREPIMRCPRDEGHAADRAYVRKSNESMKNDPPRTTRYAPLSGPLGFLRGETE